MRKIVISLVLAFACTFQETNAQRRVAGTDPPASGTARFVIHPSPNSQPESLNELCASSRLIVDAFVHSTFPARNLGRLLETDVVLLVTQTLKGSASPQQVVVAQRGGVVGEHKQLPTQYSLMQPGERYIIFLTDDPRQNVPVRVGIPRYWITGQWVGILRVDAGAVHMSSGTPTSLRDKYDRMNLEQFLGEITSCIDDRAR
jgi:hypothetical protein